MTVRIVEGKKPYTGGQAIEIDENKVISLRLRDENNLIIYDSGDDEIYVDLQLPDEITPTDAFPVGITTGRVVVDNGWDKAGTIICAKTTSGDVIKLVYADEGTLWIDNGTGTFKQIYFKSDVEAIITTLTTYINTELAKKQNGVASTTAPSNPSEGDLWYDTTNDEMKVYDGTQWNSIGTGGGTSSNTKTFTISSTSDLTNAQAALDWYLNGGNPILYHERGYTSIPMPCTYHLRETIYRNSNYEYVFVSPAGNWDIDNLEWASENDTIFHCIGLSVADVNDEPGDTVLSIREFDIKGSDYFAKKADASKIEYVTQAEYNALLPGAESDNKHYFIYTESGGGGWQPGVNTLLYFPLVSDAVDTVNNVTLTSYGTTNYTEVGGVTSAEFTKSNYLYNDSVNVIPQGNVAKTFSVWAYIKGHNSSWSAILAAGGAGAGETFGLGQYENDNDIVMSRSYSTSNRYTPTLNTWINFVMTYDNSIWTLYVNGQSQVTWNTTAPTSGNSFRISQHIGQTGALIYTFYGNLSNVILENKARTSQEISDYFNLTKGDYGIS